MPRKKKSEIKIPKARLLPSGRWFIQLRIDGKSIGVTEETEAKCKAKALAIKAGYVNAPVKVKAAPTLGEIIDSYISSKDGVLSPSTLRAYNSMRRSRFADYMGKSVDEIDWQRMISGESKLTKAKTVRNAWSMVSSALRQSGRPVPAVTLPQVVPNQHAFLSADEINVVVKAVKGKPCEVPALLALHSLRMSEIKGLTWSDIDLTGDKIHVNGARVYAEGHKLVYKETNKNTSSNRTVPIVIPELKEALLNAENKTGFVVDAPEISVFQQVNRICRENKLPEVGVHGLRHSFASLCYHLQVPEKVTMRLGGWADDGTMKKIYTHISEKDVSANTEKLTDFFTVQNANGNANEK